MFKKVKSGLLLLAGFFLTDCKGSENNTAAADVDIQQTNDAIMTENTDTITLGGGCFWCIEAVLLNLNGVQSATSGYMGGKIKDPTYREVCSGLTGHAEVVQVVYDPKVVSLQEILEVFFTVHDPTTLNRQGNDVGTQYRSAIFYHNEEQKKTSEKIVADLNSSGAYNQPLVTEVTAASTFYKAEDYHQNYYNNNTEAGYCQYVIQPKLEKFKKVFGDKMKKK